MPGDLVDRCGLGEILGMLRVRGFSGVLRRLKAEVTRAAIEQRLHRYRAEKAKDTQRHVIVRQGRHCAPSCHPAARNSPRSTAGRSRSSTSTASFYAIDDVCTHDGGPLAEGELSGCEIMCPRHGARFDVRTGKALCMPAFEPVAVHAHRAPRR